jgi:hypothetical protein
MSAADLRIQSAFISIDPNGMKWRGSWGIVGIYSQNDVVIAGNNESYICIDSGGSLGEDPELNPAVWELLSSGEATAVTMTAANGSGITVAEPTPNTFTVATNLVAGSGISLTPSGINTSLTVGNTGVLGVTSGSAAITVGGTASNPVITQALPSFVKIVDTRNDGGSPLTASGGPGGAFVSIVSFEVVSGGVYQVSGSFSVGSSASSAGQMSVFLAPTAAPGGAPNGTGYDLISVVEATIPATSTTGAAITFTVPPGFTNYGIYAAGFGATGNITGTINPLYLIRLA